MPLGLEARALLGAAGVSVGESAWVKLDSANVTTNTTIVTFTTGGSADSWSNYENLLVTVYGRTAAASNYKTLLVIPNNDATAGNYKRAYINAEGSSIFPATGTSGVGAFRGGYAMSASAQADTFSANWMVLYDINDTGKDTTSLGYSVSNARSATAGLAATSLNGSRWLNTAAVTELDIRTDGGDWVDGTRIELFGMSGVAA